MSVGMERLETIELYYDLLFENNENSLNKWGRIIVAFHNAN